MACTRTRNAGLGASEYMLFGGTARQWAADNEPPSSQAQTAKRGSPPGGSPKGGVLVKGFLLNLFLTTELQPDVVRFPAVEWAGRLVTMEGRKDLSFSPSLPLLRQGWRPNWHVRPREGRLGGGACKERQARRLLASRSVEGRAIGGLNADGAVTKASAQHL